MTHLGELHTAAVLDADGRAVLVLKGTNGTVNVNIPERLTAPLSDTVDELSFVYDDEDHPDSLIGDGSP